MVDHIRVRRNGDHSVGRDQVCAKGMGEKEVTDMMLTEYNEEETMKLFKQEYIAEGRAEGEAQLLKRILSLGLSPEVINTIQNGIQLGV